MNSTTVVLEMTAYYLAGNHSNDDAFCLIKCHSVHVASPCRPIKGLNTTVTLFIEVLLIFPIQIIKCITPSTCT